MPVGRRVRIVAVIGAALVIAGCSAGHDGATRSPRPPTSGAAGRPIVLAALGDSISRGFDACRHFGDCTAASWSTGSDPRVDSVASRLEHGTGRAVRVVNLARSGARASDLDRQVDGAIAARADVVTVLIGANDVCGASLADMTPAADVASEVTAALDRLTTALPGARVVVASIPDVSALPALVGSDPTARWVWSQLDCASVLADPRSRDAAATDRRAAVHALILADDAALRRACRAHAGCVDDGGALTAFRPTRADVSPLDFFHPSIAGLARIAAIEWPLVRPAPAAG